MSNEHLILFLAAIWGIFQLFLATGLRTQQRGLKWNMSSRDQTPPPLTGKAGRVDRAFQNFKETFPFFLAALLFVSLSGQWGSWSEMGAWTYLIARVIYLPLYTFDVRGFRSLVWIISLGGIVAILLEPWI